MSEKVTSLNISIVVFTFFLSYTSSASGSDMNAVAQWKMDQSSGNMVINAVDDHHGALYGGYSWVEESVNEKQIYVLRLNGSDAYAQVGDFFAYDPVTTQEITLAAWINVSAWNVADFYGIVGKADSPNRANGSWVFGVVPDDEIWTGHARQLRFAVCYDGLHWQDVYSNSELATDEWVHVAITHDLQNHTKMYINGELDMEDVGTVSQEFADNEYDLFIGCTGSYSDYFNGMLSDVVIYDTALTQEEIKAIVPEPTSVLLLAVGCLGLVKRRHSR